MEVIGRKSGSVKGFLFVGVFLVFLGGWLLIVLPNANILGNSFVAQSATIRLVMAYFGGSFLLIIGGYMLFVCFLMIRLPKDLIATNDKCVLLLHKKIEIPFSNIDKVFALRNQTGGVNNYGVLRIRTKDGKKHKVVCVANVTSVIEHINRQLDSVSL